LANGADRECIVIGDAGYVILCAHVDAILIAGGARAVAIRERYAFRIRLANRQIVRAKTSHARRARDARIAVVRVVARRRAAISHLIDATAPIAFLTEEAIRQVHVVIDAIGRHLRTRRGTVRHIGRTGVDAVEQVDAIGIEGTRLQLVLTNTVVSAELTGVASPGSIASTGRGTHTIETRYAGGTNVTAHAAICFVGLGVDAFGTALGQTSATRRAASAIRANFTHGTCFTAHPAIARIELRIHTDVIAFRRAHPALRTAHAIRADLAHRTNDAASTAIAGVDFHVDARIRAFRRATGAIECALAARAHFACTADLATRATVEAVIADVDAGGPAFRRSTDAIQTAGSIRANFALRANRSACAAIGHVGFEVDAKVAAFRRLSDAIERAFTSGTHFAHGAAHAAHSTVGRVDLNIDAFATAFRRSTDARETTRPIGTNLAIRAFIAACAAVVRIERGNGTRAIAIGLPRRAHRGRATLATAACGSASAHATHATTTTTTDVAGAAAATAAATAAARACTCGIVRCRIVTTACRHRPHGDSECCYPSFPATALFKRLDIHRKFLSGPRAKVVEFRPISKALPRHCDRQCAGTDIWS